MKARLRTDPAGNAGNDRKCGLGAVRIAPRYSCSLEIVVDGVNQRYRDVLPIDLF